MDSILSILKENEYAPYYANYLAKVSESDIVNTMINDLEDQIKILEDIPEEKFSFRYKEGKWSIAELLQHICDSETVFAYRALCFSRNDKEEIRLQLLASMLANTNRHYSRKGHSGWYSFWQDLLKRG